MQIRTSFIHMERSAAIETFAEQKLGAKIRRLSQKPTDVHLTFEVDKGKHIVKLLLKEQGFDDVALSGENGEMHAAVLKLAEQLDKFLRRRKDKKIKSRQVTSKRDMTLTGDSLEDDENVALSVDQQITVG